MAENDIEIERKFLVGGDFSGDVLAAVPIKQGYLCCDAVRTVRVRLRGDKGFITVKGRPEEGHLARYEWEKEISAADAENLLKLAVPGMIDKTRYLVPGPDGHMWEVDEFHGANEGLLLAEVEMRSEGEQVELPSWVGKEVTDDHRFYNSHLCAHPFEIWKNEI